MAGVGYGGLFNNRLSWGPQLPFPRVRGDKFTPAEAGAAGKPRATIGPVPLAIIRQL